MVAPFTSVRHATRVWNGGIVAPAMMGSIETSHFGEIKSKQESNVWRYPNEWMMIMRITGIAEAGARGDERSVHRFTGRGI